MSFEKDKQMFAKFKTTHKEDLKNKTNLSIKNASEILWLYNNFEKWKFTRGITTFKGYNIVKMSLILLAYLSAQKKQVELFVLWAMPRPLDKISNQL